MSGRWENDSLIPEESKKWLANLAGCSVIFDEPMKRHTSLRIGGPAAAFAAPKTLEGLKDLYTGLQQREIPAMVVGGGTNLLVRDGGFPGVAISLAQAFSRIEAGPIAGQIRAGAGASLSALCRYAEKEKLYSMAFAAGIPGTVGGAIRMNAGTAWGAMARCLSSVKILQKDGEVIRLEKHQLTFNYRKMALPPEHQGALIIGGEFLLDQHSDGQMATTKELLAQRRRSQPLGVPSAGCFFRNPTSGEAAGFLIDRAGLKGKRVGGAEVSAKHANFIINRDNATAEEILRLATLVQKTVYHQFGVTLEPEVEIVGISRCGEG